MGWVGVGEVGEVEGKIESKWCWWKHRWYLVATQAFNIGARVGKRLVLVRGVAEEIVERDWSSKLLVDL